MEPNELIEDTLNAAQAELDQKLDTISTYMEQTAANTTLGDWDYMIGNVTIITALLALGTLIFSILTYKAQKATMINTTRTSRGFQSQLFADLIQHLYRNIVTSYAIKTRMEDCHFAQYPSEEHLMKMKVSLENIHLEAVSDTADAEGASGMHNLYMVVRNYNTELEIVSQHLASPAIPVEIKQRELDSILTKPHKLIQKILDLTQDWKDIDVEAVGADAIRKRRKKSLGGNTDFVPYRSEASTFKRLARHTGGEEAWWAMLNEDVATERGRNSEGLSKIMMIPLR